MCYASSCNPICGKCRPRRTIEVKCPVCDATASLMREEYLNLFNLPHKQNIVEKKLLERGPITAPSCSFCGSDLTEAFRHAVEPLPCTYSRIICGFPCGLHTEPFPQNNLPCQNMVPLGKFSEDEVPLDSRPWESV